MAVSGHKTCCLPLSHCPPWASVSPMLDEVALQGPSGPGDEGRQEEGETCFVPLGWGGGGELPATLAARSPPIASPVLDARPARVTATRPRGEVIASEP